MSAPLVISSRLRRVFADHTNKDVQAQVKMAGKPLEAAGVSLEIDEASVVDVEIMPCVIVPSDIDEDVSLDSGILADSPNVSVSCTEPFLC